MFLVQQGSTPTIPFWGNVSSTTPTSYETYGAGGFGGGAGSIVNVFTVTSAGATYPTPIYLYGVTLVAADTATLGPLLLMAVGAGGVVVGIVELQIVAYDPATGPTGSDPLANAVPGAYAPGQAGYVLGTNLDALVSSRSTYAGGAVASVTGGVGGSLAGNVGGSVGSVVGDVGGNVVGTIGGLTSEALAEFFTTNSGQVYAGAVGGSVVHEIAANAGGSDPWATALPGGYIAGEAGYIVGTNLDALVSSRSTYAGGAVASVTGGVGGSVASIAGVTFPTNFGSLVISSAGRVAIQSAVVEDVGISAFPFVMFSSTDHSTPAIGLTVTATRSIDGGAFAATAYSATRGRQRRLCDPTCGQRSQRQLDCGTIHGGRS